MYVSKGDVSNKDHNLLHNGALAAVLLCYVIHNNLIFEVTTRNGSFAALLQSPHYYDW